MDILEIMKARHSVRQYTPRKIEDENGVFWMNWQQRVIKRVD